MYTRDFSRMVGVGSLAVMLAAATACGSETDETDNNGQPNLNDCQDLAEVQAQDGELNLDGCYRVGANEHIDVVDVDMTIEPGSRIIFDNDAGLRFTDGSSLTAVGTADEPISFLGDQERPGFWRGLSFDNYTPSILEHVVVAHAGSDKWHSTVEYTQGGVVVRDDNVVLDIVASEFRENDGAGISVPNARAEVSVTGTHFESNAYPIRVQLEQVSYLGADNTFVDNTENVVLVDGNGTTVRDGTWAALEVPYLFDAPHSTITRAITISPGATLTFSSNGGLRVDEGSLTANAEGADPIRFLGEIENQGFWRGLRFTNTMSPDNQLVNVEIRHGGSEKWHGTGSSKTIANVVVQHDSQVALKDAVVADSGGYGVTVGDVAAADGTVTGCENVEFDNNLEDDWYVEDGASACF